MPDIMHRIKITAPPEQVYQALTTADGIRNWWTRDAELDQQIGGIGEFRFYERRFVARVKVDELTPPTRVGWTVTNAAWDGKTIQFDLEADGSDSWLSLAHRGFSNADQGYARATTRWGYYLLSLRRYLQTGKGTPNPDDTDL
jgi:uncharacterized protein YndB with AHSA1/START domain